jgi:tRNA (guanine37-N1)-methyltransferase
MILKADILHRAWMSIRDRVKGKVLTVLLSPQGQLFSQAMAKELASYDHLILVCGHYEGLDERFVELCVDREVSIGDYVLTGGELPALVMTDAICRWIPGVVGKEASVSNDSLEGDLLKYPQYTRPRVYEGLEVPEVLMSGNHGEIARWREVQSRERTARKRPDLWASHLRGK